MRQIKFIITAGNTIEIEKVRTERAYQRGAERGPKKNPTTDRQKRVNERQAEKKLRRSMNDNFDNSCLYVTYMYIKEPDKPYVDPVEMDEDMRKMLRKIRALFKRESKRLGRNIEFKYVWVKAVGRRSARHFHMVMSGLPHLSFREIQDKLQAIWDSVYLQRHTKRSYINIQHLRGDHYGKLAAYFIKQSKTTFETMGRTIGKKWNASKNLTKPVIRKVVIYGRRSFDKAPNPRPGWYMDQDYTVQIDPEDNEYGFAYRAWLLVRPRKERR